MPESHAIPEAESGKKQGDKLDHVVDSSSDKGAQDVANKRTEPAPQSEPLK